MGGSSRISLVLTLVSACGFPRPADVGGEAGPGDANVPGDANSSVDAPSVDAPSVDAPPIDAPDLPGTALHVSPSGDDANDGLTKPVKTLKHAIGLAAANQEIRSIVLASGRYSTAVGETFPYTVPANVTIVGPAGGGAILAGTTAEVGMMINAGEIKDVELEDFTVAIVATGTARLANLHVRTSATALRAETTARLTVDNLDVTGAIAACSAGIVLNGAAELAVTTFATRNLGTAIDAKDQSISTISQANFVGDAMCTQAVIAVATNQTFALTDSLLDGGNGMTVLPRSSSVQVTIINSTLRNMKADAIGGGPNSGGSVVFQMTGGQLSNNGQGGGAFGGGTWKFNGVTIKQNAGLAIYSQDGTLVMRNCSVTDNGDGVYLLNPVAADLGTVADPGNNTLQNNAALNLDYDSSRIQVEAVGNIWNPGVQGADSFGRYVPTILQGPIARVSRNNYGMSCDPGQCTLHR